MSAKGTVAMMIPQRLRATTLMFVLAGCAAIALPALVWDLDARAQAPQQQAIPNLPLQLPNHRYDLPATLLTAGQIEAHKAKMLAAKDNDVPMNMAKAGGGSDKHQVGISLVYRLKGQSNPNFAVHDEVARC